jgi:flagellar biosynthesis GTPase FlhF
MLITFTYLPTAGALDIAHISDFVPNKDIFDSLILPDDRTEIIKALVQSHRLGETAQGRWTQKDESNPLSGATPFFADAIKGKGRGLLVLLHGPPGVGKTSTAGMFSASRCKYKVVACRVRS